MSFRIREARLEDGPFIRDSQLRMALETEGLRLDEPVVRKGVNAVLEDPHKGRYYLAETPDGRAAACLLTIPEWSDWRNGTVIWIHSLYVLPEFRRQGVYKAMYAHLKALVEGSPEYRGLRLYVDKRNKAAKQAYLKLGMSAEHYELYEWLKQRQTID